MTIAFRYLPYLVQQKVMDQMDLFEIFTLFTISRKSRAIAKSYFIRHRFELHYFVDQECLWIHRNRQFKHYIFPRDHVTIESNAGFEVSKQWSPMEQAMDPLAIPFRYPENANQKMLKFARELFPKLQLYLIFGASDLTRFQSTINFVKSFKLPVETVKVGVKGQFNDELMRAVLRECSKVKNLTIYLSSHFNFQYDFRTHPPFKNEFFELRGAEWVTKDHVINLFLSCKKVVLSARLGMEYNYEKLTEICQKWLEAPKMERLEIQKDKKSPEFFEKLPGAVPVRQITLRDDWDLKKPLGFRSGKCYKVEKADGTPAVVYRYSMDKIIFRTDFEKAVIGEGF